MNAGIINAAIYEDSKKFIGVANVTMPNINTKVVTVNGIGIAGDIDIPVYGHHDAMRVTFAFTDTNDSVNRLFERRVHLLDLRVLHEEYNPTSGQIEKPNHKYVMRVMPINKTGGTVAPAAGQGVSVECAVLSYKEYVNGELVENIDPANGIDVDASGFNSLDDAKDYLG